MNRHDVNVSRHCWQHVIHRTASEVIQVTLRINCWCNFQCNDMDSMHRFTFFTQFLTFCITIAFLYKVNPNQIPPVSPLYKHHSSNFSLPILNLAAAALKPSNLKKIFPNWCPSLALTTKFKLHLHLFNQDWGKSLLFFYGFKFTTWWHELVWL